MFIRDFDPEIPYIPSTEGLSKRLQTANLAHIYKLGPAWVPKPAKEQPPIEYGRYLLGLYTKGVMKSAGPFTRSEGAAIVLEASSEADVKTLVDNDPAVDLGIFAYEIHHWDLVPWNNYVK